MRETWAILPVKSFERAKTRLRPVLAETQCASIARLMAIDALDTLTSVAAIDRILVLGQGAGQSELARTYGCDYANDRPALSISQNLDVVLRLPRIAAGGCALYIPADMPQVTPDDIATLLSRKKRGLTICRAIRDGGSNAMVASPPRGMHFSLGSGSAARHASAAMARRIPVEIIDEPAFERDIDVPRDLAWLCTTGARGRTLDYLRETGLAATVHRLFPESLVSQV